MEPNLEHIKLWVEDLENGGHTQVRDWMAIAGRNGIGYCCLGRLCEIVPDELGIRRISNGNSDFISFRSAGGATYGGSQVPQVVADWLGVHALDLVQYAAMNDNGKTFAEIAAQIRKDYDLEDSVG